MRNKFSLSWPLVIGVAVAFLGFAISLWELEILAIIVLVVGGWPIVAILLGLILDSIYGTPQGLLHYLFFPFTLGALALSLIYMLSARFFIERFTQDYL